jgi:hypothetical protein
MCGSRSATLADQTPRAAKLTGPLMLGHILLLLGSLGTEETMKRRWRVRREAVERPDGQGRWDQAYQAILLWSLESHQEEACAPGANGKEEYHEGGGIRSGLDLQAGQTRND